MDILNELTDYIRSAGRSADGLREQARLALKRAEEIDEKAAQVTRDAIAIRDARQAYQAKQFADQMAIDQMRLNLSDPESGVLM